eukprot:c20165_g2_i1 orf=359-2527(-)
MKQSEVGGCCCLATQIVGDAMFPSKAERIMARFRPIAPKPVGYISNWSLASEALTSSVSGDSFGVGQVSDSGKSKRSRKRRSDCDAGISKGWITSKQDKRRCSSGSAAGGCTPTGKTSDSFERSGGELQDVGVFIPVFHQGSTSRDYTSVEAACNTLCESFQAGGGRPASCNLVMGARFASCSSNGVECQFVPRLNSGFTHGSGKLERNDGFLQRAAASAYPSVLPGRMYSQENHFGGGFLEMIRGITGLPTTAEVHTLMHPKLATEDTRSCTVNMKANGGVTSNRTTLPLKWIDENRPVAQIRESEEVTQLVTLPLLPEIPCHVDSTLESSLSCCTSEGTTLDLSAVSEKNIGCRLTLFGEELGVAPITDAGSCTFSQGPTENHLSAQPLDQNYITKVHGNSSEPVLLVDDLHRVLWFNKAYERAANAILETSSEQVCKSPYIDPLGLPTVLGTFNLQSSSQTGSLSTTLWGFLKKLVIQESDHFREDTHTGFLPCSIKGTRDFARETDPDAPIERLLFSDLQQKTVAQEAGEAKKQGVIMPQPKRLVGSTVSLERVTEAVHSNTYPWHSLAAIEAQLEKSNLPGFITDSSNRVRWVNSAYKQMVGQPECPWLASTVVTSSGCCKSDGPSSSPYILHSPRLNGEVSLICTANKIPETATAFSGWVNIQWTNSGETKSMAAPCDVARLEDESSGRMLVWKFDVAASLNLTSRSWDSHDDQNP